MVGQTCMHSLAWGGIGWKLEVKHATMISQTALKVQKDLAREMPAGLAVWTTASLLARNLLA